MNLPKSAVRRPVLTTMVFLGLMILGSVAFTRLQIDLLPSLDFPSISVVTTYQGAGPEEMETLVTRKVEEAVSTVEGIDELEGFSAEGRSRVALRFVWGTDLDSALNDVRAEIERVKDELPEDAEAPVIYKFNLSSFPVIYFGLSGDLDAPSLYRLAEKELVPRLERVEGVARADLRGGVEREVRILLDPAKLAAYSLPADAVVRALRRQNRDVPAGQIEHFDENILMRSIGEATEPADLRDIVVTTRQNAVGRTQPIYLGDIARISDTFEDPSNYVRVNGQPGIRLSLSKQSDANTVTVAKQAIREMERINRDFEGRARLTVLEDTSDYIERSISNVQRSVLIGAALAVLILLVFLRNLRSTFIIALGIPVSIIGIFTLMYYFDITLNLISFGGVALGIGLLVDNAIVILENIFRKLEEGDDAIEAAIDGAGEVDTAIIASTTTTLVVFVPVVFLSGFASIFFGQMAFVVSFALLCSLAVALTLIPMLASRFLRREDTAASGEDSWLGGLEDVYESFLNTSLAHPWLTLGSAVLLFAGSLGLWPLIGTELLPEEDHSEVGVSMELPVGTRIEVTEAAIRKIEQRIPEEVPEMRSMRTTIGTPGFWSTSGEESADIEIKLVKPAQRTRSSDEVANELRPVLEQLVPGADLRVRAGGGLWILRMLRGGGERLEVQIRGYDLETAETLTKRVQEVMEATEGIAGTRSSRKSGGRELHVQPDIKKLAGLGLDPADVADQIQTYVQGTRATVLRDRGDEYDVRVMLSEADRRGIRAVMDAPVVIPGVGTVPLRAIASLEEREGPLVIDRENQGRIVQVRTSLTGKRDLGSIAAELRQKFRDMEVPEGFSVLVKGESEEQGKTFSSLQIGILLALLLVFMVMASQFESFLQPLYIMISIPLAAIGVLAMLAATATTFNLQSFMGCIVLTGIVVNNAIVLIDYINLMRRDRGMSVREAVTRGGKRRLRPILMTTATTILALLPVALGLGEGGETQAPLARAVIGGLFVSGGISLVVIPVIYDRMESWRADR